MATARNVYDLPRYFGLRPLYDRYGLVSVVKTGSMEDICQQLLKLPPDTPFVLDILRREPVGDTFVRHTLTLLRKPVGALLVPV